MIEQIPLVLDDTGFTSLDEFPLRARFAARQTGTVPTDLARRLKPLSAMAAASLALDADARLRATSPAVSFRSDDSPFVVSQRLRELPIDRATPILAWWSSDAALVTDWGVFLERWGDFCYPAAGDVCIWPLDGGWTLCYRRYEVIQFRDAP